MSSPGMTSGPWIFGARADLAAFTGSALFALALVAVRRHLGWSAELPEWGWLVFVLGIDVAHVYATLFRTYLDGAERRRHPARYVGIPLLAYVTGVGLYLVGGAAFFRVLAYLAVVHFVRQQIGWAALYRARTKRAARSDKFIDDAALYAATGYPLFVWHTQLGQKRFSWLVAGDFVDASSLARGLPLARALFVLALAVFALRQAQIAFMNRRVDLGKILLVVTTAATWYVGIVGSSGDFDFTVTNVLTHGVPYMVLLHSYGRATQGGNSASFAARVIARGAVAFVALLVGCAFLEEAGWDRLVWHDHEWLFGAGTMELERIAAALLIPLLAVPQATHYLLDGLLWRRREPALKGIRDFWLVPSEIEDGRTFAERAVRVMQ